MADDGLPAAVAPADLDYLTRDVLDQVPSAARQVLRDVAYLEHVCADLLGPRRGGVLNQLVQAGLLTPTGLPAGTYQHDPRAPAGPWYRPVPVLAAAVRARWPVPADRQRRIWRSAADWYRRNHVHGQAARALLAGGDPAASAQVLCEHGEDIVAAGGAALVITLIPGLPEVAGGTGPRDTRLRLILGEAYTVVGDNDAALAELTMLDGGAGPVDAALAWRQGAVHYQRADRDAALAVLERGRLTGQNTRDEALLLVQQATVRWSLGAADDCGALAHAAMRAADAANDDRARAAAQVAAALHAALIGDRSANAGHYDRALRHAEKGRDALQIARIRTNQASSLLEEARYAEAAAAGERAVTAAENAGYAGVLAVALVNEAEALVRMARLAEAEQRYRRAITINQRAGSRQVAYPLVELGNLHAYRGERSLARAAYEEALRIADQEGFLQCLIPALSGLARLSAVDDPYTGQELARRATRHATGPLRTLALLATGWVAAAAAAGDERDRDPDPDPDRGRAMAAAGAAADSARRHRDRAGLAEALELRAVAGTDPARIRTDLMEAFRTWRATGSVLDADRLAVLIMRLPDATTAELLAGRLAQARLDAAGIVVGAGPGSLPGAPPDGIGQVIVRTLGRFETYAAGRSVPISVWQSRKARDLLRILVARRGRMIAREQLAALLWAGDEQPQRIAHRLSVALSTLRSMLDPDRRAPADHYIVATPGGIGLDPGHVDVDVESFLAAAELGLRMHADGDRTGAYAALRAAERDYLGDFCEEEPYDDWSVPIREEVRGTYLRVLRTLAGIGAEDGRVDEAGGYLLRILHRDPYDEQCHRDLVDLLTAAGRHGEARRAKARYLAAMRDIGQPVR
ncbi:BTAD domain-containing putative transcriptional regulator [Solwaraspora sp. WMMB335]|uniref:BTAD domain-containing putative transcriptional regulator n=1 Tax=Solwaraspora sp. WMMB335 TaxID=3404118 RepID=UPI003B92A8FF